MSQPLAVKRTRHKKHLSDDQAANLSDTVPNVAVKKVKVEESDLVSLDVADDQSTKRSRTLTDKGKAMALARFRKSKTTNVDDNSSLPLNISNHESKVKEGLKGKGKGKNRNQSSFDTTDDPSADDSKDDHSEYSNRMQPAFVQSLSTGDSNETKRDVVLFSDSEVEGYVKKKSSLKDSDIEDVNDSKKISYPDNNPEEENEETLQLMPLELRDPLLMDDYLKLPYLKQTVMLPFSEKHSQSIICNTFSGVYEAIGRNNDAQRLFTSAIKFRFSLPFINPARSSTGLVSNKYSRFVLTNSRFLGQNAVFVMTGQVTECALVNPVPSYDGNALFDQEPGPLVKRIRLRCIAIEYERFCSYLGSQLNFKSNVKRAVVGPTSPGGVVFSTQKLTQTSGDQSKEGPSTPSSSRRLFASSPSKASVDDDNLTAVADGNYPSKVSFESNVPIYDARQDKDFDFTDAGFKRIHKLPLFKGGGEDLTPEKYIATVAFAASVFPYQGKIGSYKKYAQAGLYVLFVVVIGKLQFEVANIKED